MAEESDYTKKKVSEMTVEEQDKLVKERSEDDGFLVEEWYDSLSKFTAETIFVDLSLEEAKAIMAMNEYIDNQRTEISKEDISLIRALEMKIDLAVKGELADYGFFIRLSTRSPKDGAPSNRADLMQIVEKEIKECKKNWDHTKWEAKMTDEEGDGNARMGGMLRALETSLVCHSARDALSLLTTSDRVYEDLTLALKCIEIQAMRGNSEIKWNQRISLRKWVRGINGMMEFRCFVRNNFITAISQYCKYCMVDYLQYEENREKVKLTLWNFWKDNIKPILAKKFNYIIDFAILSDGSVYLVEINPFVNTTGPILFSWKADLLVLNGWKAKPGMTEEQRIEFRVRNQPYPGIKDLADIFHEDLKSGTEKTPYWEVLNKLDPKEGGCTCSIF